MQMFLFKAAQFFTKTSMILDGTDDGGGSADDFNSAKGQGWYDNIMEPILNVLKWVLPVMITLLAAVGAIYAIVLGVNLSRAESADKREEAKKRMINFVIGIVCAIVLLLLLNLLSNNAGYLLTKLGILKSTGK